MKTFYHGKFISRGPSEFIARKMYLGLIQIQQIEENEPPCLECDFRPHRSSSKQSLVFQQCQDRCNAVPSSLAALQKVF